MYTNIQRLNNDLNKKKTIGLQPNPRHSAGLTEGRLWVV